MTKDYTLVAVDVSGIQDYIFRTNDLKHHLGASELVRCATSAWVRALLPDRNNFLRDDCLADKRIEDGAVDAEVLYSGGGNVVILFADPQKARQFIQALTRRALLDAPGLNMTVAGCPFEWRGEDADDLGSAVSNLLGNEIRRRKQRARRCGEMLGLGVTADCEFTGLPAIGLGSQERQRISAEIAAKLRAVPQSDERLKKEIGDFEYVSDFNDFGTKGESSYIAVIHADGNGMGRRFQAVARAGLRNREYILAVRTLSESVNRASQNALKATVDAIRNMPTEDKRGSFSSFRRGKLLFRPVVFGGDDATFVCDGRLGLAVAAYYLKMFSEQKLKEHAGETCPTARAGVAIVKTHFPFGQAYSLAEELAQSAKEFSDGGRHSTIDWHFGVNGVVNDLKTMRQRAYIARENGAAHSLLMRPLRLKESSGEWRHWGQFDALVSRLGGLPRNKIKLLREALRGGPNAARRYIEANLPDIKSYIPGYESDTGWIGEHCAYFDPIEAMDFFKRLETADTGAGV